MITKAEGVMMWMRLCANGRSTTCTLKRRGQTYSVRADSWRTKVVQRKCLQSVDAQERRMHPKKESVDGAVERSVTLRVPTGGVLYVDCR